MVRSQEITAEGSDPKPTVPGILSQPPDRRHHVMDQPVRASWEHATAKKRVGKVLSAQFLRPKTLRLFFIGGADKCCANVKMDPGTSWNSRNASRVDKKILSGVDRRVTCTEKCVRVETCPWTQRGQAEVRAEIFEGL
jgi:hypothetical protein